VPTSAGGGIFLGGDGLFDLDRRGPIPMSG
jgi:hypothetical protein